MYPLMSNLIFMFLLPTTCTTSKLNLTRLMGIYINACGEKGLCKDWPGLTGYQKNSIQTRCPPCSCEDTCVRKKNCCPDKFFQGKLTRFHDAVFQRSPFSKIEPELPKYHVVDTCPEFAEKPEKCHSPSDHFEDRIFVTSLTSNYTYFNVHCALCNGEKESDIEKWDISIDGDANFINFIESNEDMLFIVKEWKSLTLFLPSSRLKDIVFPSYFEGNQYFTEPCQHDEDLQRACSSSYVNEIRLYKNVFCYLCKLKSIKRIQQPINTCHKFINNKIQKLCKENPVSDLTYPYRNFYCFLCNIPTINNTENQQDDPKKFDFLDFSSKVDETIDYRSTGLPRRRLIFSKNVLNAVSIVNKVLNSKPLKNQTVSHLYPFSYKTDQLKPFLSKMAAAYPHRFCNQDILPDIIRNSTTRNCDCSFSCLFKNPCSCCLDTAIIHPIDCVSDIRAIFSEEKILSEHKEIERKIQVVNVCYEERMNIANMELHQKITQLCVTELNDFDFPVLSNRVTYRNIFCFLCNTNYTFENGSLSSDPYSVLDINIVCDSLLQYDFFMNFSEVITHALKNKCDMVYGLNDIVLCHRDEVKIKETKNECKSEDQRACAHVDQVEHLAYENKSIQSFLLSEKSYEHDLCQLCNFPNNPNMLKAFDKKVICKESNIQHVVLRNACLSLPNEKYNDLLHPYRNIFCSFCMEEYNESQQLRASKACQPVLGVKQPQKDHSMRDLFVPTMRLSISTFKVQFKTSEHACYPGRALIDGACKPIIASPGMMKYHLHIRCSLQVTSSTKSTEQTLSSTRSAVWEILSNSTYIYDCRLQRLYLLANPSDIKVYQQGLQVFHLESEITLHYFLFCSKKIKPFVRDSVENSLLQTPHMLQINQTVDGLKRISLFLKGISFCNISKTLTTSKLIPENDYRSLKNYYNLVVFHRPGDGIIVSKLLMCLQRVIDANDVTFDSDNYRIFVKDSNEVFYLGEYVMDYNYKIRVCAKVQSEPLVVNDISDILEIFTNVLNIISILSIFLLLVVYLKFPGLRTLPGLNVMSASFSLMCMQLTYTVANVLKKGTLSCRIVGVVLHYFWLCLCCCLFICCLHMFLTFKSNYINKSLHGSHANRLFRKYILFSYLFPFLVVSINVILSHYIEGGIGYGNRVCFVEQFIQNIVTFIVPLLLTCISNVIMFILTIINIDFDKNIQKSRENRSELIIFTKLFCLTGSVWILQVIDSFLQISFFSFMVTILTSSQGIFIFLSFSSSSYIKEFFKSKEKVPDRRQQHFQ